MLQKQRFPGLGGQGGTCEKYYVPDRGSQAVKEVEGGWFRALQKPLVWMQRFRLAMLVGQADAGSKLGERAGALHKPLLQLADREVRVSDCTGLSTDVSHTRRLEGLTEFQALEACTASPKPIGCNKEKLRHVS